MITAAGLRDEVEKNGFAICDDILSLEEVIRLVAAMNRLGESGSSRKRGDTFAVRNLLDTSAHARDLAHSAITYLDHQGV